MRLLVLGGTVFLGRHLTEHARARGHELTLFNRGRSGPGEIDGVEQIHGDREAEIARLGDRRFDAVIDTSGYVPRVVAQSVVHLAQRTEHYVFVSSISAYADFSRPGIDEDDSLAPLLDPGSEDVAAHYGALKAACEGEVQRGFGDRCAIVRPGLIVGPHDPTERFTYWVRRLAEGGRALVPDAPDQPVQLIDVRDLALWLVELAEHRVSGTFNATGPERPLTFKAMLDRIEATIGAGTDLVWVSEDALAGAGVEGWQDLPLWLDVPRHPGFAGFLTARIERALAAGLRLRPLGETVRDTLAWVRARPGIPETPSPIPLPPAGLSAEREAELLARLAA